MTVVRLSKFELDWIRIKLSAELLTYLGRKAGSGLFPKEERQLKRLRAFNKKLAGEKP